METPYTVVAWPPGALRLRRPAIATSQLTFQWSFARSAHTFTSSFDVPPSPFPIT